MQTLRICDIGLPSDVSHTFHSMLKVLDGRFAAAWQPSEIDHADVLIAHADSDSATLSAWGRSEKPVVMVIDDRRSWPAAPFVLRHPFRVMQLLSMLDDVVAHLNAPRSLAVGNCSAWTTAESLRRLMVHAGERGWHAAAGDDGAQVWIGDGHAYAQPAVVEQLRAGQRVQGAFVATDQPPQDTAERLALGDLGWFVGLHGSVELAPWLAPSSAYRLRRWPDFGRLGAITDLLELSALTAAQAHTPSSLAAASGHPLDNVHRFLSAASLAGLLTSAPRIEPAVRPPIARPKSGWMRFVGDLRRHLRLVA